MSAVWDRLPAGAPLVEAMPWPEVEGHLERGALAIVPVGSTEQHGRHLPLGTDALIAAALALTVAPRINGLVWPAVSYGFRSQPDTGGGEAFPGSAGLSGDVFSGHLAGLLGSLLRAQVQRIVVVNAHYENAWFVVDAIERALDAHAVEARILNVRWAPLVSPETLEKMAAARGGDYDLMREHGAIGETSLMLEFFPELVRELPGGQEEVPPALGYQAFPQPAERPDHDGVLSSADGASAEIGRAIVSDFVAGLSAAVEQEFGAR